MGFSERDLEQFKKNLNKKKTTKSPIEKGVYKGQIWIPENVPSLKNSKQIFYRSTQDGSKVPFISSSENAKKYQKNTAEYYRRYASVFRSITKDIEPPYYVQFVFVRSSRRKFDFNNANHMVTDMMAKYGWLEDDDTTLLLPVPKFTAPANYLNPQKPGVWITVLKPSKQQ